VTYRLTKRARGSHTGAPAIRRVLVAVTNAARESLMFEPGRPVVVGVSGGADSLCLLHSMVRLERLLRVKTICFHFDHGLRDSSAADAAYVRRQARTLGAPFVLRSARAGPQPGESVEAWARSARYEAMRAVADDCGAGAMAVAHTADDQAETVLIALLRGGGLDAVKGMEPVTRPLVRPLLGVSRDETEAFCRALRLRPRRDPMNEDRALLRAAVRHDVLPLLERAVGRDVRATVARTASLLADDAAYLDLLAREAAGATVRAEQRGVRLDAVALHELPRPIARRVVRRALYDLGLLPELAHIDAVVDLAAGRAGRRMELPQGLLARRDREYVRVLRPSPGRSH